jgi:hypothetical protein
MNIKFLVDNKDTLNKLIDHPYPASKVLPAWYKKLELRTDSKLVSPNAYKSNALGSTIRTCMPVFDLITAGYHIPLHVDTHFQDNPAAEGELDINWGSAFEEVVTFHPREQYRGYPVPEGYYDLAFKWITPWVVQTPPGWSCLFVPPAHYDQPFQCLPAFVDTDKHPHPVNLPFFLKNSFRGLIPRGTPLIQVIPIKREKFKSSIGVLPKNYKNKYNIFKGLELFNVYKKYFRSKKVYEQGGEITESKCPFSFLHK